MPKRERQAGAQRGEYAWTSTHREDSSSKPNVTWSVQFALLPSEGHCAGGGECWSQEAADKRVHARSAETLSTVAASRAPSNADSSGDAPAGMKPEIRNVLGQDSIKGAVHSSAQKPSIDDIPLFATTNANRIRVYQAVRGSRPRLLQVFTEPDSTEAFYVLTWTYNVNGNGEWWIAAAGLRGVIRVVNVSRNRLQSSLAAHGDSVNDLAIHPRDPALLLSASKDESIRMWNLRTSCTVAIFAGLRGHRGEVLYVDFNLTGSLFVSSGIDCIVRVWEVSDDVKVLDAIKESHDAAGRGVSPAGMYVDDSGERRRSRVALIQFPLRAVDKVHKHYVDCTMWVGGLLLSKSIQHRILLWEPLGERHGMASPAKDFKVLQEYALRDCAIWFLRFALDRCCRVLACGNEKGFVFVYELDDESTVPTPLCVLSDGSGKDQCTVRQCAFSSDASILVSVDDRGRVIQYERVP